jgi:UDP-N-acetyl-D-mannosaminuronic acid dehydrogenase
MRSRKICVVGLGYIGLPTACYLAKAGYKVLGVDVNKKKVLDLEKNKLPFEEPGLETLFKKAKKNLSFSLKPKESDVFIISVPTPLKKNKKADLTFLKSASEEISKVIKKDNLVVIESTVPPGTAEEVVLPILKKKKENLKIYLSHAPERAIPGKTLKEMVENDRIIGGTDKNSTDLTKEVYSSFVKGKIYLTNVTTAEFVKLIENTYRDVNIAFANELAKICDEAGINVWEARKLANLHPRVNIHLPGPGVGGHCISIDPWFLIKKKSNGVRAIKMAREINDSMPSYVIKRVSKMLKGIKNPTVTILGIAYKANVDDWRETPALKIIELAKKKGWKVKIHDPFVKDFPYKVERKIREATKNSDCLILITNHDFYKEISSSEIKNMRNKNIFDTRNYLNKDIWDKAGFNIKILGKNGQ